MLKYGTSSWFYREITEFARQTIVHELLLGNAGWPFCYHGSFIYAVVSDISYIAESVASWANCGPPNILVWLLHNIDSNKNNARTEPMTY